MPSIFFQKTRSWQLALVVAIVLNQAVVASDWNRFRGPNGTGVTPDETPTPVNWSDDENVKWKLELPGPGHSCPIVVGDRVFVTCWTGYGLDRQDPGNPEDLERHLICVDRKTGEVKWNKAVPAELPEDRFGGMFAEHGYATHTPASDGEKVFAFFGKSGVHAFDLDGNELWKTSVGTDLDERRWGSASSPILYKNLVLVPAAIESHTLVALDKESGEEVWSAEAEGFGSTWGSPALAKVDDERTDIVIAVPYEIWGFNPENGKLRWYCEAIGSNSMCSSVLVHDDMIYAMESGPGGGGAVAMRGGGNGDVTDANIVWTGQDRNRIGTPVIHDGRLYWVSGRVVNCIDAKSGDRVYQSRLTGGQNVASEGGEGSRGGGRPGRSRGGQDYSSPVVADGKLYYICRNGDMYVLELGPEFKQLAVNRFASDGGEFSSTPAISDGELFIRSTRNLYCIGQ